MVDSKKDDQKDKLAPEHDVKDSMGNLFLILNVTLIGLVFLYVIIYGIKN